MKAAGMLGKPLASGRTAHIYPWGEGHVVKLFHTWVPLRDVESERNKASVAYAMGLPTPAVGHIVHEGKRVGLVFEQVIGRSMLEELMSDHESGERLARQLAKLHKTLHEQRPARALPAQADMLKEKISKRPELSDPERSALLDAVTRLRRDETLCHGDFHPGNVMLTDHGPMIIDWLDTTRGNPMADVARTSLLFLEHMEAGDGMFRGAIELFHQTYLDEYMQDDAGRRSEYEQWLPIVAAARLAEGIEGRQEWLVKQAQTGLNFD